MKRNIVETEVWCIKHNQQEQELLGKPEGDQWMPIVFRMDHVISVKLAGENDFIGDDKAHITLSTGDQFTIKITYENFKAWWMENQS